MDPSLDLILSQITAAIDEVASPHTPTDRRTFLTTNLQLYKETFPPDPASIATQWLLRLPPSPLPPNYLQVTFYLSSVIEHVTSPVNYSKRYKEAGSANPSRILADLRGLIISFTGSNSSSNAHHLPPPVQAKLLQTYVNLARCISMCHLPFDTRDFLGGFSSLFLSSFISDALGYSSGPSSGHSGASEAFTYAVIRTLIEEVVGSNGCKSRLARVPVRWRKSELEAVFGLEEGGSSTSPSTSGGGSSSSSSSSSIMGTFRELVIKGLGREEHVGNSSGIAGILLSTQSNPAMTNVSKCVSSCE